MDRKGWGGETKGIQSSHPVNTMTAGLTQDYRRRESGKRVFVLKTVLSLMASRVV